MGPYRKPYFTGPKFSCHFKVDTYRKRYTANTCFRYNLCYVCSNLDRGRPMTQTRVAIYTRVSTGGQTTENQVRELRAAAERLGHQVVAEFTDSGISGAKGREQPPGLKRPL